MIFIFIAVLVFITDYSIKKWAEKELSDGKKREIGRGFSFKLIHNSGFACNKLDHKPALVKVLHGMILVVFAFYALAAGLFEKGKTLSSIGSALILGGGFSNFYDRVKKGYVTDYLGLPVLKKLVFNLSDLMIFLGGILIFLGEWKNK